MRRLIRKVAALALAAMPVMVIVPSVHLVVGSATGSGSGHVLADDGVVNSKN